MTIERILLVDDESAFCELCSAWLEKSGYEVVSCGEGKEAQRLFTEQQFDLVLQDLALPPSFLPEEGLQLIALYGDVPTIVLTGHDQRELAIKAMHTGAWDFLGKPVDPDLLLVVVQRAIEKRKLVAEVENLKRDLDRANSEDNLGLIGASEHMDNLRELIRRIAPTDVSVLIQGPSGTGKELIAKAVHRLSQRQQGPFISVHCGAIPGELLESELFGYKKGAFTGADRDRKGLLSMADKGTLFLDEIGEMPLQMQVKLLRVLQEGSFYPVGSREVEHIDMRLVSATNRDLPAAVTAGKFRDDLYYRIKGLSLLTPALSDRITDIPILIQHFLLSIEKSTGRNIRIDSESLTWFCQQSWPGNVRELKNTLESIAALCIGEVLSMQEVALIADSSILSATPSPAKGNATLDMQVSALEIHLIQQALQKHNGNKTKTAETLGLTRQGLLKKINRYGITA